MLFCGPQFCFQCTVGTQHKNVPNFSCPVFVPLFLVAPCLKVAVQLTWSEFQLKRYIFIFVIWKNTYGEFFVKGASVCGIEKEQGLSMLMNCSKALHFTFIVG